MLVGAFAVIASLGLGDRRLRTVTVSLGLLTASAVLVHITGGLIEAHFHFFVVVTILSLYEDWLPFLPAIAFRSPERPAKVTLSAEPGADAWTLRVADNGVGVDPGQADRIFKMFQRLHTREEYPGTGIGLAVCSRIVERHGGRTWVEPTPGGGATFCFTLPAAREAALAA